MNNFLFSKIFYSFVKLYNCTKSISFNSIIHGNQNAVRSQEQRQLRAPNGHHQYPVFYFWICYMA